MGADWETASARWCLPAASNAMRTSRRYANNNVLKQLKSARVFVIVAGRLRFLPGISMSTSWRFLAISMHTRAEAGHIVWLQVMVGPLRCGCTKPL